MVTHLLLLLSSLDLALICEKPLSLLYLFVPPVLSLSWVGPGGQKPKHYSYNITTMAPIVEHHPAGSDTATADPTTGRSAHQLPATKQTEHQVGQFGESSATAADDNFDDVDDTRDDNHDVDAAAVIHQTSIISSAFKQDNTSSRQSSSLFMDESDNYNANEEDAMMATDLNSTALMTSFDALEDIDLMNSPPRKEQQQQSLLQSTDATTSFSADEELARQLQAEEDESARKLREAAAIRKQQAAPMRKAKKSWLDDLIGEPFPSEMKRHYAKPDSSQNNSGLMAAIAAADARVTSAAIESSILVDNNSNTSSMNAVDEGINQLSASISKWWSS